MTSSSNQLTGLEIAIIGMAGRFPGAPDLDAFWRNLSAGVESITFFADDDLLAVGVDPAALSDPSYVKAGGALEQADRFDAGFFGYSPREAALIDPQQRVFLETSWQALEHASYDPERYSGQIGVFGGVSLNRYWLNLYTNHELRATTDGFQGMISNDRDFLTTRVSYKLNLTGPSVTVQTACSTSLVAVHLACQSLLSGGCDIALAGGSSIGDAQSLGYWYQEGGIQSPDGHCRAFDAQARGTVSGNGVGVVVLKRLEDALADGDTIHAVIRGSAINNDGALKVGYTAPSIDGQVKVIRAAQLMAEIEPETIGYIEAHGTGTPVGDPIEITALARAFGAAGANTRCAIGAVKTNIGHLDAAAGVAGLIKTVLALKHRQIPPSLHFQTPNPQIDFAGSRFYVNTQLSEWTATDAPRRAGVSSFGIGGTNAHLILEEAPTVAPSDPAQPWQLLLLSAKTETALEQATDNLLTYLRENPATNLADVAYTLQVGRKAFSQRRAVVCRDRDQAIALLEARDPRQVLTTSGEPRERPIVFLFPGQGAQYVGMGRDLYDGEPVFRQAVDRCAELLRPQLGVDLRNVLYPGAQQAESAGQQLSQTWLAQPALFVVEYALAQLWISYGVRPGAMLGHSIGEYVAATLAGVLSLADALKLVAARGRLMQQLPGGSMLGVALAESALRPLLGPALDLAAINGPASCVVSGSHAAIEELRAQLAAQGIESRLLHTSHAFHSAAMDAIRAPFAELVGSVRLSPPQSPYLSNLTGGWISAAEATDPRYWARHLRETVRFAD
ncbi:MAG TPA: type I polyketide synthase, partial [Herpetosiphonaceae bacterium]